MKRFFKILVCFLALSSCSTQTQELEAETTVKSPVSIEDKFTLSEMGVKEIEYFFLETGNNFLIGEIKKILDYQDFLFIHDSEFAESLFVFNKNGNLFSVIETDLDGPEAISEISDFTVDTKRDEILILNTHKKQVLRFSFSGKLISDFSVDAFFQSIAYHRNDDKIVLSRVTEKYPQDAYSNSQVIVTDNLGNLIARHLPATDSQYFLRHYEPYRSLVESRGSVYYAKPFIYKVWEVGSKAKPYLNLEYGKWSLESYYEDFNNKPENLQSILSNVNDYIRPVPLSFPLENQKWIHMHERKGNQIVWHFHDEGDIENHLFKYLINDIDGGILGLPVGISTNGVYFSLPPEVLYGMLNDTEEKEKLPIRLRNLLEVNSYNGDDQVIALVKF